MKMYPSGRLVAGAAVASLSSRNHRGGGGGHLGSAIFSSIRVSPFSRLLLSGGEGGWRLGSIIKIKATNHWLLGLYFVCISRPYVSAPSPPIFGLSFSIADEDSLLCLLTMGKKCVGERHSRTARPKHWSGCFFIYYTVR
jgi:hypothetical protein